MCCMRPEIVLLALACQATTSSSAPEAASPAPEISPSDAAPAAGDATAPPHDATPPRHAQPTPPRIVHAESMAAGAPPVVRDAAPHEQRRVDIGTGVVLEVLDWGGSGAPVVLLAGLGNSAHIFDDFAPALVDRWHVLGVSRRGFGASTAPQSGYDIPTLGADIIKALDALGLPRATFVGHSIASEEMNWLGSEHPERVAALVYVDAAYDRVAMRAAENKPRHRPDPTTTPDDLGSPLAYAAFMSRIMKMPIPLDEVFATFRFAPDGHFIGPATEPSIPARIGQGVSSPDYSRLQSPILALYAEYDDPNSPFALFAVRERERLARAVPLARVVAIPRSRHYLFITNREEVLRELRGFLAALEPPGSSRRGAGAR